MPVRIECTAPGFEQNWVEMADTWTRREVVEMNAVSGEAFWELLRKRTISCHLVMATGVSLDTPAAITTDAIQDADELLLAWLGYAMPLSLAKRRALGEVSARVSSNANAVPA
jgi:hypothetical protein